MTELTRAKTAFNWTTVAAKAFEYLRSAVTSSPVVIHPDVNKQFYLETDASEFAIGAVLLQKSSSDHLHPVAYYSRKLLPAESNYTVHDKELLAIVSPLNTGVIILPGRLTRYLSILIIRT